MNTTQLTKQDAAAVYTAKSIEKTIQSKRHLAANPGGLLSV